MASGIRVFFSTGEFSAENLALSLVQQLSQRALEAQTLLRFEGIGGARFREAGAKVVVDSSSWGVIGLTQGLYVAAKIAIGYQKAKKALAQGEPGLFIPIDFGYLNMRLASFAKKHGWKVLYFMPPGSWRRCQQGKDLPLITDAVVTPFKWSAEILNKIGTKVFWFGHPYQQLLLEKESSITQKLNAQKRDHLAFLPGSRRFEVRHNMVPVAQLYQEGLPYPLEFALAQNASLEGVQKRWDQLMHSSQLQTSSLAPLWTQGDTYEVLNRARAAIVCSGTATLEAALLGCPMVVLYRGPKLLELEFRIRRPQIRFISLPNIILDRKVLPELIQWDATPERIRSELESLLGDTEERKKQLEAFEEMKELLGPKDAVTQTSHVAMNLIKEIANS
jgi:lipid-A-disaccharide synthase